MSSGQGQGRGGGGLSARQVPRLLFAAVLLLQQARDGSCASREPRKKGLIDEKVAAGADEPADPTALTYTHLRYHRIPNRCNWEEVKKLIENWDRISFAHTCSVSRNWGYGIIRRTEEEWRKAGYYFAGPSYSRQGGRQSNEWQYYTCDSGILVTEANIRPHLAWQVHDDLNKEIVRVCGPPSEKQRKRTTHQIDQARCGRDNLEQLKTGLYLLEIWRHFNPTAPDAVVLETALKLAKSPASKVEIGQSKPGSLLREIDRLSSLKQDDGEGEGEGEEDEQDPKNSICYRRCVEEESFNFTYHSVAFSDLQPVREILDDFQKKFCEGMSTTEENVYAIPTKCENELGELLLEYDKILDKYCPKKEEEDDEEERAKLKKKKQRLFKIPLDRCNVGMLDTIKKNFKAKEKEVCKGTDSARRRKAKDGAASQQQKKGSQTKSFSLSG